MAYETDDQGRLLMNLSNAASEVLEKYSRYNGGWIKKVEGLNKSVTDGFSIVGDFAPKGLTWHTPGLYLDCSIDGSRKNQERFFTLFALKRDGSIQKRGPWRSMTGHTGGDWAPRFWPQIEEALADPHLLDPEEPDRLAVLLEQEARLEEQLAAVRAEIEEERKRQEGEETAGQ